MAVPSPEVVRLPASIRPRRTDGRTARKKKISCNAVPRLSEAGRLFLMEFTISLVETVSLRCPRRICSRDRRPYPVLCCFCWKEEEQSKNRDCVKPSKTDYEVIIGVKRRKLFCTGASDKHVKENGIWKDFPPPIR